jgi:hypothetical protein
VITFDKLADLRQAVGRFATSVATESRYADAKAVAERLAAEHLNGRAFVGHWGRAPLAGKRR